MFHLATGRDSPLFRSGFHSHTWRVRTKHTKRLPLRQRLWGRTRVLLALLALVALLLLFFCFFVMVQASNKQTTPAIQMRHKGECTGEVNRPPESSDAHSTTKVSFILRNCGPGGAKHVLLNRAIPSDPWASGTLCSPIYFLPPTQGAPSDVSASDEEIELKSVVRSCCCQATQPVRAS